MQAGPTTHKQLPMAAAWSIAAALRAALAAVCLLPALAGAQATWHCSRTPAAQTSQNVAEPQEEFKLSSFDAISVTLQDLLEVYTGRDVKLGAHTLVACFMPGDEALSQDALQSLGLKSQVMQKLAARSAIAQSPLRIVNDEQQMLQCMEKNFPSFGYFSREVVTEKVVPCF